MDGTISRRHKLGSRFAHVVHFTSAFYMLRWQLEVTPYQVRGRLFQEVRTHLGVETQRQWSDLAIARTTPVLLGLFSWTTLAAHALQNAAP